MRSSTRRGSRPKNAWSKPRVRANSPGATSTTGRLPYQVRFRKCEGGSLAIGVCDESGLADKIENMHNQIPGCSNAERRALSDAEIFTSGLEIAFEGGHEGEYESGVFGCGSTTPPYCSGTFGTSVGASEGRPLPRDTRAVETIGVLIYRRGGGPNGPNVS